MPTHPTRPPRRRALLPLLLSLSPFAAAWAPAAHVAQRSPPHLTPAAATGVHQRAGVISAVLKLKLSTPRTVEPPRPRNQVGKIGILLLNLGGPDTLDDVEPFLYNLFADPEIITLPRFLQWLNGPIAWTIAKTRAPASSKGYASIGGGSPQLATTIAQGEALTECLGAKGITAKSYVAMRYWSPFTEDALASIKADGVTRLVVLPLYPQFSISTSGSSLRLLERDYYADQELRQVRNVVIPSWYNREGYVNSVARLIAKECDKFDEPQAPYIFFSAHGLPVKYIDVLGDPYKTQTEATVKFVMNRLQKLGYNNKHTLAYQSRVGPVEWVKPYTDETIRSLAASGVTKMVTVPISFVSEHIETLEEIDIEYAELARDCGITEWRRVPVVGTEPDFISDLADAVIEALPRTEEPVRSEISEGRPVSLRVVNDLVQLRGRGEEIEYGPVRYEVRQGRIGFNKRAELINGRIAMAALTAACIWSYNDGTLWSNILDGRLPFSQWLG